MRNAELRHWESGFWRLSGGCWVLAFRVGRFGVRVARRRGRWPYIHGYCLVGLPSVVP